MHYRKIVLPVSLNFSNKNCFFSLIIKYLHTSLILSLGSQSLKYLHLLHCNFVLCRKNLPTPCLKVGFIQHMSSVWTSECTIEHLTTTITIKMCINLSLFKIQLATYNLVYFFSIQILLCWNVYVCLCL